MRTLLLAAHGDGDGSESNLWALELAARTARLGGFSKAVVGFQKGTPAFSEVLEEVSDGEVVVVPLMAAAGYYAGTILPRELEKNANFSALKVDLREPIGTLPEFHALAEQRVRRLLSELDWREELTSVVVVGHGTRRHQQSRRSTELLSASLAEKLNLHRVTPAFLDEDPGPEKAVEECGGVYVLVLPFLMGSGTHATQDLPRRVKRRSESRPIHIDQPLGTLPGMEDLILLRVGKGKSYVG